MICLARLPEFENVKLETLADSQYTAKFTGYAVFKIDGKQYRRKTFDKILFSEYRFIVRFKNNLYYLPYNIESVSKGVKL